MPVSPARRASPRRLRVPPALVRGSEALPASAILDELPGGVGVVLWSSARNVALWAATPPGRRGRLFDPAAAAERAAHLEALEVDAELLAPLSVIVRLVEDGGRMEDVRLVNACRRIALWAEQRGALGTALEFAQCAALVAPEVAALAYAVGRLARRRAEYDRAETWYGRSIVQSRRTNDWRTYVLSYSGLGNLHTQKGNFPVAERAQLRGLKAALRHRLVDLQGIAYHDLFVTRIETGAGAEATDLAAAAFQAYGPAHPQLPRLAFDVAYHWILQEYFEEALRVAEPLALWFDAPAERALVLSLVARSAGGVRDRERFGAAKDTLTKLLSEGGADDAAARALLGVAYGAVGLEEWSLAEETGSNALRIARERCESRLRLAAEACLDLVRSRPAPPEAARPADAHSLLADRFVVELGRHPTMVPA